MHLSLFILHLQIHLVPFCLVFNIYLELLSILLYIIYSVLNCDIVLFLYFVFLIVLYRRPNFPSGINKASYLFSYLSIYQFCNTQLNLTNKVTSISISLKALAPSSVFLICSSLSRTVFFLICSCSCMMRSFSLSLASWRKRSSSALRTFCISASRCSSSSFSR